MFLKYVSIREYMDDNWDKNDESFIVVNLL